MAKFFFLLVITLFVCTFSYTQQLNKKVNLTGDFPDVKGAKVFMYSQHINAPLNNGKFNLLLDSVKEGEYTIAIIYPWAKADTTSYIDSITGNIIKKVSKFAHNISLSKHFYINPNQSLNYHFQLAGNVTPEMLNDWEVINYEKTDIYGVKIISNAEDTRLYDKFEQLNTNYEGAEYYIEDSLHKQSTNPNKDYRFYAEAAKLNYTYNYPAYANAVKNLIKKNLSNPISALAIVNIPLDWFVQRRNEYEGLLNKMTGRAKKSDYYTKALLKLKDSKEVLNVGKTFVLPSGKTPDLNELKYNPTDYKYTLVEFWASWCEPCRADNPKWNLISGKYSNKGFQILGISLDQDLNNWKKAITDDHLEKWLHVSDLANGNSFSGTNALMYGIDYIPFNVLIDSTGKIVKRKIQPEELEEFLNENLK